MVQLWNMERTCKFLANGAIIFQRKVLKAAKTCFIKLDLKIKIRKTEPDLKQIHKANKCRNKLSAGFPDNR